jgi:hypothetical protein
MLSARNGTSYNFNGLLGQNVYVFPDLDMVIGTNAGNPEVFQKGDLTEILYDMIDNIPVSDTPLPRNAGASAQLKETCLRLAGKDKRFPEIVRGGWGRRSTGHQRLIDLESRLRLLAGCTYNVGESGIGLFPLLMQVCHNNFTDGITAISFAMPSKSCFEVNVYEGDMIYNLPCGIGREAFDTDINMHGEVYRSVVRASFSIDEYGRLCLMIRLIFTEEATERRMNIYFGSKYNSKDTCGFGSKSVPEGIDIHFSEYPGNDMITQSLKSVAGSGGIQGMVMNKLADFGAMDIMDMTLHYTISPRIHGTLVSEQ